MFNHARPQDPPELGQDRSGGGKHSAHEIKIPLTVPHTHLEIFVGQIQWDKA